MNIEKTKELNEKEDYYYYSVNAALVNRLSKQDDIYDEYTENITY